MRSCRILIAFAIAWTPCLAADTKLNSFRFMKEDVGRLPPGWTVAKTGMGEGSVWKVVVDASAPSKRGAAMAQLAKSPKALFNLCIADAMYKDLELSVSFKAVAGEIDQGGGVMWRVQDANNYYIARMNPLEGNYRVYKVVDGKRIQLETAEDLKAGAGEWHNLRVRHVGDKIECFLDAKKVLDAKDNAIAKEGKVGLWTKADAQTHFDDFKVQPPGK